MNITIDIDRSIPEFARHWLGCEASALVEQIKRAVLCADLCAGEPLPSELQLANDLGLERAVVSKAYRRLQYEEVIESGFLGSFVHRDAVENCGW